MTETFLIDASGDFYGCDAKISFLKFLREEKRMQSLEELRKTLREDTLRAREYHEKREK